jgi:hypothetical protein
VYIRSDVIHMSFEEPPWLWSESTWSLSSALSTPRAPLGPSIQTAGREISRSLTCRIFNDLPRLWFRGVSQKVSQPYLLRRCFRGWRAEIERRSHNFQFQVLIVHRGLYVAVPHRSHYGRKVAGSHQNSRTVVMSRTVENQLFRKARFVARFSAETAN